MDGVSYKVTHFVRDNNWIKFNSHIWFLVCSFSTHRFETSALHVGGLACGLHSQIGISQYTAYQTYEWHVQGKSNYLVLLITIIIPRHTTSPIVNILLVWWLFFQRCKFLNFIKIWSGRIIFKLTEKFKTAGECSFVDERVRSRTIPLSLRYAAWSTLLTDRIPAITPVIHRLMKVRIYICNIFQCLS